MGRAKNGVIDSKYMLRREDYKKVKKMDRQQFEMFCKDLHMRAYEEGRKSIHNIDVNEIKAAIMEVKGIGEKRLGAIMERIDEKFGEE